MKINTSFWKNKKVFITGHTGFKGSWLSFWLQSHGAMVKGYSLPPLEGPSFFKLVQLDQKMNSHIGNICDFSNLAEQLQSFDPDIIFHLAAQALVRDSYRDPRQTFATNIMGTINLLEASRTLQNFKTLVIATSDKCYENKESGKPFKEGDCLGGHDPYSASKAGAEIVSQSYYLSFFKPLEQHPGVATVRAGNVIGGGDWSKDRLVPDFVRAIEEKKTVLIRSPQSVRPWQHVLEALSGYICLAEKLYAQPQSFSRAWNFGPNGGSDISVSDFMERFVKRWGSAAQWELDPRAKQNTFHEATLLKLNIQDAETYLNWKPKMNIDQAIDMTVDWYKSWLNNENMSELTHQQILDYENRHA